MTTTISASMNVSITGSKVVSGGDATVPAGASMTADLSQLLAVAFKTAWGPSTTIDGTDLWTGEVDLAAGVATIDLTALVQASLNNLAVNATGKKIRVLVAMAPTGNANKIQIGTGASNGYPGIGVLSEIQPGQIRVVTGIGSAAIDGTHKTLDLVGTLVQKLYLFIVFGT